MEQNEEKHSLTTQDIEQHLQSALAAATPNVWPKLDLSVPQDKPKNVSRLLRLERKLRYFGAAAACICLIAAGGIYHYECLQVVSVVGIDVNPSLCLSLNRIEKVIKAEALNSDGEKVLDQELKGKTLESAVGHVVDSLVEKGYLKEGQQEQAVLVSVSGKNVEKAEKIKTEVTVNMENAISQKQVSAVVYDQTIDVTKELEELAKTYQVSVGKAGFIEQLVQENEALNQDAHAAYEWMMSQSMEAITQEISENAYSVSPRVNVIQVEPAETGNSREDRPKDRKEKESREKVSEQETISKEEEKTENGGNAPDDGRLESSSSEKLEEEKIGHADGKEEEKEERPKGQENQENSTAQKETEQNQEENPASEASEEQEELDKSGEASEAEDLTDSSETLETETPIGEATSSTVGAKEPETEPAERTDKPEDLEETAEKPDKTKESDESLVEFGQMVKGELWINKEQSSEPEVKPQEKEEISEDAKKAEDAKDLENRGDLEDSERLEEPKDSFDKKTESEAKSDEVPDTEDSPDSKRETGKEESRETESSDEESQKNDAAGETENSEGGESVEAESPENGETEETENPKGGETEKAENPKGGETEKAENPEGGGTEEAEHPGSGKTGEMENSGNVENPENERSKPEEAQEKESESETKAGKGEVKSANQVIRVKVEKKEWKEPKEPVYASQLLGFSHRRLLTRGPGAFEFIIADPEKIKQESRSSKEDKTENAQEDEDEQEILPDAEDEWGEEEDWDAEMGEWLHIGPGYPVLSK